MLGPPSRAHVLVADDESPLRDLVCDLLADEGFRVSARAATGLDRGAVGQIAPDVLVFDPGLQDSRWQLPEQLRANPTTADLPIVVCTGAMHEVRSRSRRLADWGAELVPKPFNVEELVQAVEAALGLPSNRERR